MARGFFREAEKYGFGQADYVRFVNRLLDLSMKPPGPAEASGRETSTAAQDSTLAIALPLFTGPLCIRTFESRTDLPYLRRWLEDQAGRYFLLARTMDHPRPVEDLVEDPASVLGMIVLPDGRPIGALAFLHVDRGQQKAELRKLIGEPSMRGKGYGKAATQSWISYGLEGLGLRKIYLNTLDTNLRNIRLNEELGFRVEGILRNEVTIKGRCRDVLRMALWRDEYQNGKAAATGAFTASAAEAKNTSGSGAKALAGR